MNASHSRRQAAPLGSKVVRMGALISHVCMGVRRTLRTAAVPYYTSAMALDPELKAILGTMVEGQARHDAAFVTLTGHVDKVAQGQSQLVEGQAQHAAALARHDGLWAKLGEGQARQDAAIASLTERVDQLAGHMTRSAGLINALAEGQAGLVEQVKNLTARVDGFTEVVLRGFTDSAARDPVSDKRVDELESRVAALEHSHT